MEIKVNISLDDLSEQELKELINDCLDRLKKPETLLQQVIREEDEKEIKKALKKKGKKNSRYWDEKDKKILIDAIRKGRQAKDIYDDLPHIDKKKISAMFVFERKKLEKEGATSNIIPERNIVKNNFFVFEDKQYDADKRYKVKRNIPSSNGKYQTVERMELLPNEFEPGDKIIGPAR